MTNIVFPFSEDQEIRNRQMMCQSLLQVAVSVPSERLSNQLFQVAKLLFHAYGLSEQDGFPILEAYNRVLCDTRWSEEDLRGTMAGVTRNPPLKPSGWRIGMPPVFNESDFNLTFDKYMFDRSRTLPIAETFVSDHYTIDGTTVLKYHAGDFLKWEGNVYRRLSDIVELKSEVLRFLTDEVLTKDLRPFPANEKAVMDVLAAIQGLIWIPNETRSCSWIGSGPPPCGSGDLIFGPTRNYNWRTDQFYVSDPRWFNLSRLSVDVDPNAPLPCRYLAFLDDLFGDDDESKILLNEYSGLLLTNITSFHKMLLMVGPKRSGKGTHARLLRRLHGETNVSGPRTAELSRQFGLQNLIGKSIAIIPDARFCGAGVQNAIEVLLNISGEDSINIDRKYRDPETIRLGVRFLVLSNEEPRLPDSSGAIVSRFLALKTVNCFLGREDQSLEQHLYAELPGILNCYIQGLRSLMARGHFVQPASGAEIIGNMQDLSSPIEVFVRECCLLGVELECPTAQLYDRWKTWSETNGYPSINNSVFGQRLHAAYPMVERRQSGNGYIYAGIAPLR